MADFLNCPDLVAFLRAGAGRRFVWGECDCLLWMAEWVSVRIGVDPARELRGAYRNALAAKRIVDSAGGELALVSDLARRVGLSFTDDPLPGDIGLVKTDFGYVGAIRLLRGWAIKADLGVALVSHPARAAWSV
jgi:hypothetical protein